MLGAVLQGCIKDEAHLQLHSFPSPSVKTGSFVQDIFIREPSWAPNSDEMRTISAEMIKLAAKNLKIERLEVSYDLAMEMFKDNPYKKEQLPFIKGSTSSGKFKTKMQQFNSIYSIATAAMAWIHVEMGKSQEQQQHKLNYAISCFLYLYSPISHKNYKQKIQIYHII